MRGPGPGTPRIHSPLIQLTTGSTHHEESS
jgi:hypothetical protein